METAVETLFVIARQTIGVKYVNGREMQNKLKQNTCSYRAETRDGIICYALVVVFI